MAQWSRADRTLYAKVVYYGPAFGGKTTNLEALHRLTDPDDKQKLLSVKTSDDRTLFFDLLPFDLGDILGYQVALKLYTVPGQVRYDTTRQVVLSGADALVFVADSTAGRREQNVWSLQNLQINMRAKRLDPRRVPVLFQFNKQDLPESAPAEQVASWLGVPANQGFPAVAVEGRGVLETFRAACRAMLERLVAHADGRTREKIDADELGRHVDRAFAPYIARAQRGEISAGEVVPATPAPAEDAIVLGGHDLLERAVQTGVKLGEKLSTVSAHAKRLEREAEAFRSLSESLRSVGANFERDQIIDASLDAVTEIVGCPVVTLVHENGLGQVVLEHALGHDEDPLLGCEAGRRLVSRMIAAGGSCVVDDLAAECADLEQVPALAQLRAVAAVPVETESKRTMLAYAPRPDGVFHKLDVRFLATVAGHLNAGLEKSRLHESVMRHRDRLEETVSSRTEQLREAYDILRNLDAVKDNFLSNLSHEMKTPLTAILSSAVVLRDYKSTAAERRELVATIAGSAETLQRHLEDLFRLVNLEGGSQPLQYSRATPRHLIEDALQLAGTPGLTYDVQGLPDALNLDFPRLARAVANLVDNARKFSPIEGTVELKLQPCPVERDGGYASGMAISVLDRGPGVEPEDRERIFAPFEQGGDPLTSKPFGIGLGLHEARAIARSHGGLLEYLPREGGGSEFRIVVPLESSVELEPLVVVGP